MTMRISLILATALTLAGCSAEPDPAPDTPAPADNIPAYPADPDAVAPGQELPVPDTLVPAGQDRPAPEPGAIPPAAPGSGLPRPGGGAGGAGAVPGGAVTLPDAAPAAGQQADEGAAVLQRAATAYGAARSLQADFVMNLTNPLLRQQVTSRGTLYQRSPDRIALRFSEPAGDMIVGDGEFFWVYYPSTDPAQVIRSPASAAGERGVDLQAQFVGDPVRRFQYTYHGQETVAGRATHVMTLVPRQQAEYRSLKVWLDGRDAMARRFEITEHNGVVRRFDLANVRVNTSIPDATFRFTPPAGARVVNAG